MPIGAASNTVRKRSSASRRARSAIARSVTSRKARTRAVMRRCSSRSTVSDTRTARGSPPADRMSVSAPSSCPGHVHGYGGAAPSTSPRSNPVSAQKASLTDSTTPCASTPIAPSTSAATSDALGAGMDAPPPSTLRRWSAVRSSRIPRTYRKAHEAPLRNVRRRPPVNVNVAITASGYAPPSFQQGEETRWRTRSCDGWRRRQSVVGGCSKFGGAALLGALLGGRSLPGAGAAEREAPPNRASGGPWPSRSPGPGRRSGGGACDATSTSRCRGHGVPQPHPAGRGPGLSRPTPDGGREARAEAQEAASTGSWTRAG